MEQDNESLKREPNTDGHFIDEQFCNMIGTNFTNYTQGKSGFNISEDKAADHIFGFTVAHDVSARDWQLRKNGGQWLLGKSMNAFCPLGPCITTTNEIGDPHNLNLKCVVNGETKQNSNTKQLVFNTNQVVAWCSQFCTLLPGDLILTGTPPGVGCFMKPPQFLKVI